MDKPTLKLLGAQLRKEIVPLADLPFTMRAALKQLSDKYDEAGDPTQAADSQTPSASNDNLQNEATQSSARES